MGPPDLASRDLKITDSLHSDNGNWNKKLLSNLLPNEAQDILYIRPSKMGVVDILLHGSKTTGTGGKYQSYLKPCDWIECYLAATNSTKT